MTISNLINLFIPTEGLEPSHQKYQILSLARLPFRHVGILLLGG